MKKDGQQNLIQVVVELQAGEEILRCGQVVRSKHSPQPSGQKNHVAMEVRQDLGSFQICDLIEPAAAMHENQILHSVGQIVLNYQRIGIGQVD